MSKIFKSATELIGNTPLVELTNFEKRPPYREFPRLSD